ncbi:YjcZ family sporulation protein [Paenibacillus sp. YYML68]|nr:YjcZ family sporulation protein [Paenibacillus sp. YYML68]
MTHAGNAYTTTGAILVLFILLVIICSTVLV